MAIESGKAIEIFYKMIKARLFEEKAALLKQEGFIEGDMYLSAGQEATAAAVCALSGDDAIFASHRNFTVLTAADTDTTQLIYELMGIKQGLCCGRAGQSSYADNTVNFFGSSPLAGSCFAKAVGAALSYKIQGAENACICFASDGACAGGDFYEALNEAAILGLPVVFFIENNCYAGDMPVTEVIYGADIADKAKAFDIPGIIADGNNAPEVYEATVKALEYARLNSMPAIVESKTYRLSGFDTSDKQTYRSREEVRRWAEYDCLDIMSDYMLNEGMGNYEDLVMLKKKAQTEIDAAADTAVNMSGVYRSKDSERAVR